MHDATTSHTFGALKAQSPLQRVVWIKQHLTWKIQVGSLHSHDVAPAACWCIMYANSYL